jgi:hypothetical protein
MWCTGHAVPLDAKSLEGQGELLPSKGRAYAGSEK